MPATDEGPDYLRRSLLVEREADKRLNDRTMWAKWERSMRWHWWRAHILITRQF